MKGLLIIFRIEILLEGNALKKYFKISQLG